MVIDTNTSATNVSQRLSEASSRLSKSLARLASGSRLVSPEDDAAGLAQATILNSEKHRDSAASTVLENAISYSQTQDGYLQKIQKALDRMGELAVMALDGTKTDEDRSNLDSEFQALRAMVDASKDKDFNGLKLFDYEEAVTSVANSLTNSNGGAAEQSSIVEMGTTMGSLQIQYNFYSITDRMTIYYPPRSSSGTLIHDTGLVSGFGSVSLAFGPGTSTQVEIVMNEGGSSSPNTLWNYVVNEDYPTTTFQPKNKVITEGNGTLWDLPNIEPILLAGKSTATSIPNSDFINVQTNNLSIANVNLADEAVDITKDMLKEVAARRAQVGANLTRLQSHVEELSVLDEAMGRTISRLTDTDISQESSTFARNSILTQLGTAMLAQANSQPQSVLRLLAA